MKSFFEEKSTGVGGEIPLFLLEIMRKYFGLEVEGLENIPTKGRCLITPNHSGVTALDAVMIGNEIFTKRKRIPRMLAHPLWFITPNIRVLAKRIGLDEANKETGEKLLREGNIVILFPEGAAGNFKPTSKRYQLQEFKRGFIRMAMATQTPIIPTVVIGAEETNINLSSIKLSDKLRGTIIPIPLNFIPLPAKWKIIFLPPVSMKQYKSEDAANTALVHKAAEDIRRLIQTRIDQEIAKREWIYFPRGAGKRSKTLKNKN
jgi:1-acyl-sn-glycerol-3-phosphate acyltransferase